MAALTPARRARAVVRSGYHAWRNHGKPVLHLLHLSKTGGTALKHVMSRTFATNYRFELHAHPVTLAEIPQGEKVCFVVREPEARFVSGFNSRLRQGGQAHSVAWTEAERIAFERFRTPDELACALYAPDLELAAAARAAMQAVRHLRVRQIDWVVDLETLRSRTDDVLFVGRQWSLAHDFARLVRLTGMPTRTALPTGDAAHRTPAGMSTHLSVTGRVAVRRWYADDLELLTELARLGDAVGYASRGGMTGTVHGRDRHRSRCHREARDRRGHG